MHCWANRKICRLELWTTLRNFDCLRKFSVSCERPIDESMIHTFVLHNFCSWRMKPSCQISSNNNRIEDYQSWPLEVCYSERTNDVSSTLKMRDFDSLKVMIALSVSNARLWYWRNQSKQKDYFRLLQFGRDILTRMLSRSFSRQIRLRMRNSNIYVCSHR